jgi:hypothetical protein
VVGPGGDVLLEFFDRSVHATADEFHGDLGEPSLDEVRPGGSGRGEVQVESRVAHQPVLDRLGFVGGQVVADQVDVQVGGDLPVDGVEELSELDRPVP